MSEITTKFDATNKLRQLTDDSSRYALGGAHVMQSESSEDVYLTVTDGRCGAINRVSGQTNETVMCPADVLPTKLKGGKVECNGRWTNDSGKWSDTMDCESRFPRVYEAMPDLSAETHLLVSLDANLLRDLCEAMVDRRGQQTSITLAINTGDVEIDDKDDYRHVESLVVIIGQPGRIGVLMPVTRERQEGESLPSRFGRELSNYRLAYKERGELPVVEGGAK